MNSIQHFLTICMTSVIVFSLSGCISGDHQLNSLVISNPDPITPTSRKISTLPLPLKQPTTPADTVSITLYPVDRQCQTLVPTPITVPADQSLEVAITQILEWENGIELPISYRVEVNQTDQSVTIDLRVPTKSQRRLISLSSCEQLALFGSLRQTLTMNSLWQIDHVYFTHRGEEILF